MKPVVILAQAKDLLSYVKGIQNVDRLSLLEINKRLLKMQLETSEILEKIE
ncbi:MAG: hypothetical protein V1874_17855 [Spirochaetota bacterium]